MSDINSVTLVGRVTRDVDERGFSYLPNGTAKLSVSLAVNRSVKKGEEWVDEPSFFDVTFFGKGAEGIRPHVHKGSLVGVQGCLRQDRWEKDGQKMSRVVVVADNMRLLGGKSEQGGQQSGGQTNSPSPAPADGGAFPEDVPF